MNSKIAILACSFFLLLAACGGSGPAPDPGPNPGPSPDAQLVEANQFKGGIPADAETVSPEEFKKRLASGETVLTSSAALEAQNAARQTQYQDDKSYLAALPTKSPYLQSLLEEAAKAPNADSDSSVKGPGDKDVVLFGLSTQLRNAVETYKLSLNLGNAVDSYTLSYNLLSADLKAKADSPEGLKSLEQVNAAASKLDALLVGKKNPGGARPETSRAGAFPGNGGQLSSLTVTVNAGNGTDNDGPCAPTNLVKDYWFPLKSFVSPVKNQAKRGTCWAFAAIGALESRERVQNNNAADLSEQFLVNKVKREWDPSNDTDGGFSAGSLNTALNKGQVFPSEAAWTYNPARGRPYVKEGDSGSYANTCNNYSGTCSETAHESREVCTTIIFNFCSYVKVNYSGAGVGSSSTTLKWKNGDTFLLDTYTSLLENGYTLLADFPVYDGFRNVQAGVVSDYSPTGSGKGHAVQLVGFISNDALSRPNAPSNVGGGGYFILKNSWGCGAGDSGYYYVPADYVSRFFGSLSVLNFDGRRSDAWNQEQAAPGGAEAPKIKVGNGSAQADLRVEKDLAGFFTVSHPVAKSVNLRVTSDVDGTLYDGAWNTETGLFIGPSLKYTFKTAGTRNLTLNTQYGNSSSSASLSVNVVNTPPTVRLEAVKEVPQGEDFFISASIKDINEPDLSKLCANTTWSVDSADTLSSTTGCTTKVKFAAQGLRTIKVKTVDSDGASGLNDFVVNVLPPPANPYPRITSSAVSSREYTNGRISFCGSLEVPSGNLIDMTQKGCSFLEHLS